MLDSIGDLGLPNRVIELCKNFRVYKYLTPTAGKELYPNERFTRDGAPQEFLVVGSFQCL